MTIECDRCHARYRMDPALFKGARGVRVRCRKCGNFMDVVYPVGVASGTEEENDTSFSRNPSYNGDNESAVSLAGQERSTALEAEPTLPKRVPARLSREDEEDGRCMEEIRRKTLPISADTHAPEIFYPPLPKSPDKIPGWTTFQWFFLIFLCAFLFLFIGGYAYLVYNPGGKGMLSDVVQTLANIMLFFRS